MTLIQPSDFSIDQPRCHPEDDESAQAVAIREARQALESAATHLPMGSEADVLAAKALATIFRLENTQH